jgi:Fic family protein
VPAGLLEGEWRFGAELTTALLDAEQEIRAAQAHARSVGLGTLAEQLLRSESMASTQIEGIPVPSHRSLAKTLAGGAHRPKADAALANIAAVKWFYEWAGGAESWSIDALTAAHRRVAEADEWVAGTPGEIRDSQNWIGPDPYTPVGADFVPPPARLVLPLLEDLCEYLAREAHPALAAAAIAHAQFETIHPFPDGNGRVGRALIGAVLRRRGVVGLVIPPISLVLARYRDRYLDALTAFRFESIEPWIGLLADAAAQAAAASIRLADQVSQLQDAWREQAQRPRRDSAAEAIIRAMPGHPMFTLDEVADVIGRSHEAARNAVHRLADAGVVRPVTVARKKRIWESVGLFALIDEMERSVGGPRRGPGKTAR